MIASESLVVRDAIRPRIRLPRSLLKLIVRWRRHRQNARAWAQLSRLDENLRYDLGIDFMDLAEIRRRAGAADPVREMVETEALLDLVLRRRSSPAKRQ